MYAKEGTTVNLVCPLKVPVDCLSWRGPPRYTTYISGNLTAALKHVSFLHTLQYEQNTLQILNFRTENEGSYKCSSLFGGEDTFNVSMFPAPQFLNNFFEELYVNHNTHNELKLQYVANPDANYSVFKDNRAIPIENFNLSNINILVRDAIVQKEIYDKLVHIKGYEMYIGIYVANTLDFNNITIVLRNDRGWANHTIQVISTELQDQVSENGMFLAILATSSLLVSASLAFGLKLIYEKCIVYFKKSCEGEGTGTLNDTEEDSHYGASTTHTRQSEPQDSYANDIYGDVSQLEACAKVEPFVMIQKCVGTHQSSSTEQSNQRDNHELNYIEVAFDHRPKRKRHKFYCDDRTPYADVDLTIKVDPLPDSDSDFDSEDD